MIGRLHVLTDFHFQQRHTHAALARLAAAGGADTVQFRQKEGTVRERWVNLVSTAAACRAVGVPLIVDDDLALALATGADGVHLGQTDLPVAVARAAVATRAPFLIGATASTVEEALAAEAAGADYVGFGPVFPTLSKRNPQPVRGLGALRAVCHEVRIPVVAIAGLTPARVAAALGAGAWGVAVMTAVSTAADPQAATAAFREAIERELGNSG